MIIWAQHCFKGGGGIEKHHSLRSLSIGLNIFCERLLVYFIHNVSFIKIVLICIIFDMIHNQYESPLLLTASQTPAAIFTCIVIKKKCFSLVYLWLHPKWGLCIKWCRLVIHRLKVGKCDIISVTAFGSILL